MSLKSRITLFSILTTFVVAAILASVGLIIKNKEDARVADAVLTGNRLVWDQLVAEQRERTTAAVEEFNKEFELRAAIKAGDRGGVAQYADRYVNLTRDAGRYDLLQIFNNELQPLYSSTAGLSLQRVAHLLDITARQGELQSGLFAAADGGLYNVVAFPVQSRRKLLGVALYAKRLDEVLARFAKRSTFGVALSDAQGRLLGQSEFPELDAVAERLPALGEHLVDTAASGERQFVLSVQAVADATAQPVAHLLVARDDTEALNALQSFTATAYLLSLLVIAAGVGLLFFVLKRYLAPLQDAVAALSNIASGDLTTRVQRGGTAEIGVLQQAMDDMVRRLRELVGEIARASGMIRDTSGAMGECVDLAGQGVSRQDAMVEAITTSLHEMSASVADEAKVTEQAAATAVAMQQEADQGHQVLRMNMDAARLLCDEMAEVSGSIDGLNQHANLVTEIVNVIKSIAEQTNLLALNAAIEAARAGEQGRGFAVVADEVRGLANRTQRSVSEIEDVIAQLVGGAADAVKRIHAARESVDQGARQAETALNRFDGIKQRIGDMVDINQTVASAVEEQTVVAQQITANMAGIREVSRDNATRSEYLNGTARSLNEQATVLREITARFRHEA